jgi:capsular exopolysaccharide synthesis family protein
MNKPNDTILDYFLDFVRDLLKYWYVAAISLLLSLGVALFYLKFAAKTYQVNASVLLRTEKSNAYGGRTDDLLKVYEMIERDKNLQNEVYFLQSSPLIKSVVEEMDLMVSYYLQEDKIPKEAEFSLKELYTNSPFIIIPSKKHLQPVNMLFWVKILNEESFMIAAAEEDVTIVDFTDESVAFNSTPFKLSGTFKFGEEIGNTFSSFRVLLNSNYNADMYLGKDLFFRFNTNQVLTNVFKGSLSAETSDVDATMVDLSFKCSNVEMGISFLNGLIHNYIDRSLEEKNYLAVKTIEHLDFQLSDISNSLGSSEEELQNIRRSTSVMNIDEKAGNLYNQIQTYETQKDDIERRRGYLMQMDEYFAQNKDSTSFLAPSSMGLDDPLLNSLIGELTTLNSEKQQIINNNQLRNPRLRTIEASISNLKEVIVENLKYSINTANAELREVQAQIRVLQRDFNSLPYTQRRLLGIERKFNLNENIYMSLLEQRIQAQIIKSSNLPDCEIVEPPFFASVSSPKKMVVLIGALFIGMLIPIIFIFSKKLFTTRVIDKEELRNYTKLSQIGAIPQSTRTGINVIIEQPNSVTAEAFHSLRSNIIYYLMGKTNQVILVTSTMEGEGKSFSALNIASSLAVTNNKTVLVEFDLRRPSDLYSRLGIRGLVGVSSYLINKSSLDEITINSGIDNLDIVLAGQIPPNPIELISSRKTEQLFEDLRKKYDYIVIDTPPYGVLTDSFVLMKFADIKIYVARLGYVKKRILISSLEDIEAKNIDNVQILLNGESPKQGSYGKYYTNHRKGLLSRSVKPQKKKNASKIVSNKHKMEV